MIAVKFYAAIYNEGTPQEKVFGLFRWYRNEQGLFLEQWNVHNQQWENHPDLIAVTGSGSDTHHYEQISTTRAAQLLAARGGMAKDLLPSGAGS